MPTNLPYEYMRHPELIKIPSLEKIECINCQIIDGKICEQGMADDLTEG